MVILDYFALEEPDQARMRKAIGRGDWRAAQYLRAQLEDERLRGTCGPNTRLLLGLEGTELAAFCTLADQDDVVGETDVTPWIGFVYTFPAFRGARRSGEMIEKACEIAREMGNDAVYLSSNEIGLYEKYGFQFWKAAKDVWGEDTRVYRREL